MTVNVIPPDAPVGDIAFQPFFEEQRPYVVAVIDGYRFLVNAYDIDENAHGATNTGQITFPIAGNPDFSILLFRGDADGTKSSPSPVGGFDLPGGASDYSPVYIEIYEGLPTNLVPEMLDISQLTRTFMGIVDQYTGKIDKANGTITFALRSLAAPLVDNKITTLAINMTSLQFVKNACAQYGLNCVTNIIGTPITIQEVLGQMNIGGANLAAAVYGMHIWDLILKCAEFDDVDVWEDSRTGTIHYEAPSLVTRNRVRYLVGKNVESLDMMHSPQFSRDIQVEVRTYQHRTRVSYAVRVDTDPLGGVKITTSQKTVTSSPVFGTPNLVTTSVSPTGETTTTSTSTGGAYSSGYTGPVSETGKERYIIYVRNLSPAAANNLAKAKWRQISMHEYAITLNEAVTAESLATLVITTLLELDGAPYTMFNDTYWPRRISRTMNVEEGWKRVIEAVNHVLPQGAV